MARYEIDPATGEKKRIDGTERRVDQAARPSSTAPAPKAPKGKESK